MKSKPASPEVDDLPALKVLARARAERRMPHAVLLTGADGDLLTRAAERLAGLHLGVAEPLGHPDCNVLRPAKKSRRINIESTQEVVAALRLTSLTARRVVLVHEPDRFMSEGANCFLKTLEEPPPGTLIVLQTPNYYRVLPTILSRCLRFHVGGEAPVIQDPAWGDWLRDFDRLLAKLAAPALPRVSELFIPAYALCARFETLLELLTSEALDLAPPPPPGEDRAETEELELAHEESIRRGVRARLLTSMEERLRLAGRQHPDCLAQVAAAIDLLESARARLELNYPVVSGLEQFFLRAIRLFALRVRP